ncbi:MAG: hypothetical protein AAFY31_03970 [Pseudomonadota bacterium]
MNDTLSNEDWKRIVLALSQFQHNQDFLETLEKVKRIIGEAE